MNVPYSSTMFPRFSDACATIANFWPAFTSIVIGVPATVTV